MSIEYNRAFKTVRNRLRKYPRDLLIAETLGWLAQASHKEFKELASSPPWILLLLLKWTVLYGDKAGTRKLSKASFTNLIERVKKVEEHAGMPDDWDSPALFLRAVVYQQHWLQGSENSWVLGRQIKLFGNLDESSYIGRSFRELEGMTIQTFLELGFIVLTPFLSTGKPAISRNHFQVLEPTYGKYTRRLLASLSRTIDSAKEYITAHFPPSHDAREFRERTPFEFIPLLAIGDHYHSIYRPLLSRSIGSRIYRILRQKNAAQFMKQFGSVFESYVGEEVARYGRPFAHESKLKGSLGASGKVVDFAIWENDANIFIDAKGVELSMGVMTARDSSFIKKRLRDSVIRGIIQANATIDRIENTSLLAERKGKDNYALVVTYQDTWLGSGRFFAEAIGKHSSAIRKIQEGSNALDLSRVFFVSIHEFEMMIECASKSGSLVRLLEGARTRDRKASSQCLKMEHHLNDMYGRVKTPQHLKDCFQSFTASIYSKIPKDKAVES